MHVCPCLILFFFPALRLPPSCWYKCHDMVEGSRRVRGLYQTSSLTFLNSQRLTFLVSKILPVFIVPQTLMVFSVQLMSLAV